MKRKKERKETPFFARFVERQEFPKVRSEIKAGPGGGFVTMKWPSDDADEVVIPWP